jgi:hypothetical protein
MLDAEILLFMWARRAIAVPGTTVADDSAFMRGEWVAPLRYSDQSVEDTIEAFRRIRTLSYVILKAMADDNWEGLHILGADGGKIPLDAILGILAQHVDFHMEYINRNVKLWEEQK